MDTKQLLVQFGLVSPSLAAAQLAVEAVLYTAASYPVSWTEVAETYWRYIVSGGPAYSKEELATAMEYALQRGLAFEDVLNFHLSK